MSYIGRIDLVAQGYKFMVSWNCYGVQISAFRTREEAMACWRRLEDQGLQPTVS